MKSVDTVKQLLMLAGKTLFEHRSRQAGGAKAIQTDTSLQVRKQLNVLKFGQIYK